MGKVLDDKLIVAITSRALFDMRASNAVYAEQGADAYRQYQIDHEMTPYEKGPSYQFIAKLLSHHAIREHVEVVLLSRNSSDTGLRVLNSITHYDLPITRAVFTKGRSPYSYLASFQADIFLSAHVEDTKAALEAGYAAATIWPDSMNNQVDNQLRIAFDGDAVLFSDEAEVIYQQHGLDSFIENEVTYADTPLAPGPFQKFFLKLARLQSYFTTDDEDKMPIRTALITARSMPAHTRVIKTIRSWGVQVDEAIFLAGTPKGDFLRAFGADIYFDDQKKQCKTAIHETAVGHVPHGVVND